MNTTHNLFAYSKGVLYITLLFTGGYALMSITPEMFPSQWEDYLDGAGAVIGSFSLCVIIGICINWIRGRDRIDTIPYWLPRLYLQVADIFVERKYSNNKKSHHHEQNNHKNH